MHVFGLPTFVCCVGNGSAKFFGAHDSLGDADIAVRQAAKPNVVLSAYDDGFIAEWRTLCRGGRETVAVMQMANGGKAMAI